MKINNSFLIFFCLKNKIKLCEIWESKQSFHDFLYLNTLKICNLAVFQLFDCIQDGGGLVERGGGVSLVTWGCVASYRDIE